MFKLIGLILKIAILIFVLGFVHRYISARWDLGSLGFRPVQGECFGIQIDAEKVYGTYKTFPFLPKGQLKTQYFSLEYNVPRDNVEAETGFCLGQDK